MPDSSRGARLTLPVFLLSAAVLALELLMVRLLAVGLWHHVTYMVVTVALLAFGLAGTVLAVAPSLGGRTAEGRRRAFAWCAVLFGLSGIGSLFVMAGDGIDTINLVKNPGLYLDLFMRYMVTGLPLFFGGLGIVVGLKGEGRGIARVYFSNLLGSALGCVLFVFLLQPLTGPGLLGLAVLAGGLSGVLAARAGSRIALVSSFVTTLLGVALIALPGAAPEIRPVDSKMMAKKLAEGGRVETTLWNPICRIDVVTEPGASSPLNVYQDGDAPTWIFKGDDKQATSRHDTLIPYLIRPDAKSLLVIGSGGGREIATALSQKLDRIVGLDINSATVSLLKDRYREYSGDIAGRETVDLIAAEGRAWLSHTDEKFDFIQMTGVDTYAALNSGAYVLSESYLYTAEAMKSYLDHLTPAGFVSILRFYFEPPRESLRLFVTALEELKSRGVADPGRQALVVAAGSWAALIMGHGTIPPERLAEVRDMVRELEAQHASEQRGSVKIVHDPERELETPFSHFARAIRDGREESFKDEYLYEVSPARDDSPFFYNFHRWDRYFEDLFTDGDEGGPATTTDDEWRANTGDIPLGIMVLVFLLLLSTAAGLIFVLGPLLAFRRRALKVEGKTRAVIYFTCLGVGFMFVEIGLAQRFALFLGHPVYSLAVVIAGMLAFSGLGSLLSGRLSARTALRLALPLVIALVVALIFFLPHITQTWLESSEAARVALALAVLGPAAFFMGMPMPSGLRILGERGEDLVPWAWAANSVASVAGSILAIILAMVTSFTGVLIAAAGLYLLAMATRMGRQTATP